MPIQYKKMEEMYSETGKIEKNILWRLIKTDPFGSNDYVGPYAIWIVKRYLTDGEKLLCGEMVINRSTSMLERERRKRALMRTIPRRR